MAKARRTPKATKIILPEGSTIRVSMGCKPSRDFSSMDYGCEITIPVSGDLSSSFREVHEAVEREFDASVERTCEFLTAKIVQCKDAMASRGSRRSAN